MAPSRSPPSRAGRASGSPTSEASSARARFGAARCRAQPRRRSRVGGREGRHVGHRPVLRARNGRDGGPSWKDDARRRCWRRCSHVRGREGGGWRLDDGRNAERTRGRAGQKDYAQEEAEEDQNHSAHGARAHARCVPGTLSGFPPSLSESLPCRAETWKVDRGLSTR